jgi:hypothetical protein
MTNLQTTIASTNVLNPAMVAPRIAEGIAFNLVTTPQEYGIKYNLPPYAVAYDHCISENSVIRYSMKTHNKTNPSATTRRISQLLDFIRQLGYEPPNPNFFNF